MIQPASNPLGDYVEQLEGVERALVEQLDATRIALRALRSARRPPPVAPVAPPRRAAPAKGAKAGRSAKARRKAAARGQEEPAVRPAVEVSVKHALRGGPLSPQQLAERVGMTVGALRYAIKPLERTGVVVATGKTLDRRYALPAEKPAKEAP